MVFLAGGFFLVKLAAGAWWIWQRADNHIGGSTNLFHGQQFAAEDIVAGCELLTDSRAEQLSQHRHIQVSVNASPAATFEVVKAQLFLRFTKAVFHRPASERDAQKFSQRPPVAARHAVGQKEFRFVSQHVASHNQCALTADQLVRVSFPPAACVTDFPDLAAAMRVLDAIPLRRLFSKRRCPPLYCRLTPVVCWPLFAVPVSSTQPIASG